MYTGNWVPSLQFVVFSGQFPQSNQHDPRYCNLIQLTDDPITLNVRKLERLTVSLRLGFSL